MWINIKLPGETIDDLQESLSFLQRIDEIQIARHALPHPYQSGIRYVREAPGREEWQTAIEALRVKRADCEDLAAYLAAFLVVHGEPSARAFLRPSVVGYHCVVSVGAQILDPSAELGM